MKPIAWSYTALTAYETCPRQFYRTRVKKDVVSEMGEEAKWGDMVHKKLEARLKDGVALPPELAKYEPLVAKLDAAPGETLTEHKLCINNKFEFVDWFDKQAWCRGIIDVGKLGNDAAFLADYKTGKIKHDLDQLKLFAALGFGRWPQLKRIRTAYIWLKHETIGKPEEFHRDQVPAIWQDFLPRVQRIEIAHEKDRWPVNPSGLCGWCPVKDCEHWKPRRNK